MSQRGAVCPHLVIMFVFHRVKQQGQGTIASNVVCHPELCPTRMILATPISQRFVCYWTQPTREIKSANEIDQPLPDNMPRAN